MKSKKIVVIKFGGNALNEKTGKAFCHVVAKLPQLGYAPVIVHGGGPQINALLDAVGVQSHFVGGLRYTDEQTLKYAEMALSGQVNKMLVQFLGDNDITAVGISGKDGKTLMAEKLTKDDDGEAIDLGFVGQVCEVKTDLLKTVVNAGFVPVMAPLAYGVDGNTYNINADYAAAAVASALSAEHFIMMTNIEGLLDGENKVLHHATTADIHHLIDVGVIAGGMIPKTLSAVETLKRVGEVNIIDGREADNLLDLLSGEEIGTTIVA